VVTFYTITRKFEVVSGEKLGFLICWSVTAFTFGWTEVVTPNGDENPNLSITIDA
jgi:hypothetical protein